MTGVQLPFLRSPLTSQKGDRANNHDDASVIVDALRRQFRASTRLQGHQIVGALQMGYEVSEHIASVGYQPHSNPLN